MYQLDVQLRIGTPTIIVDMVDAFMGNGTFVRHFESACAGDTDPVRNLLPTIEEMVEGLRGKSRLILCTSKYHPTQFVHDGAGLRGLCSDECPEDFRVSLRKDIQQHLDPVRLQKTANSILSANEADMRGILYPGKIGVLVGVTGTSCIEKSLEDIRRKCIGVTLVVPKNAVASRKSRKQEEARLFEQWSKVEEQHVIVVDSWRSIRFTLEGLS